MIVTVTLNAAITRTLTVPNFQRGQRHRASQGLTLAGGKGVNVARALKQLDVPVVATGLAGGSTGTRIVEELTAEAVLHDFVRIVDESRTTTAVVDPTASTYTEINEWGPHAEPAELETLLEKIHYLSRDADFVVFCGSLPRGVADDFYAEAIRDLNRRHVRTVLDSEGVPLRLGVDAEPALVSPNQSEAESLVGQEFDAVFEQVDAIVCPTSPSVAFTMGSRDDPLSMYMCDVVTLPANLAGVPGISVPCGFVDGLPVGLQVIAPRFADSRVFRVAHAYEQATAWHTALSPFATEAA